MKSALEISTRNQHSKSALEISTRNQGRMAKNNIFSQLFSTCPQLKSSFNNFYSQKKAIGAVVASSLLLIVAVVAIVAYQGWFAQYSDNLYADIETKSDNDLSSGIEDIISGKLYFKNAGNTNISYQDIKIDGISCNLSGEIESGVDEIDLENCTQGMKSGVHDVVLVTSDGVIAKKLSFDVTPPSCSLDGVIVPHGQSRVFYNKSVSLDDECSGESRTCSYGNLGGNDNYNYSVCAENCTELNLNGGEWVTVLGNPDLNTSAFCVMKYEAKNDGSDNPISQASDAPWVSINQASSRTECDSLNNGGDGKYHLITNAEWTTVAREIENIPNNWDGGSVGSGSIPTGNSDSSSAMDGAEPLSGLNKRTLELESGEVIWDLAGNVWEWNNDTCTQGDPWYSSSCEWINSNVNVTEKNLAGPEGDFTSSDGVGRYIGCGEDDNGFLRGGTWDYDATAGVFTLSMNLEAWRSGTGIGFRCTYAP